MASLIYSSFFLDLLKGNFDFDVDTIKGLLVTSTYTASKQHDRRNDITNEISGTGYTAGGATLTATPSIATNVISLTFGNLVWTTSTITNARAAVLYKSRGGASSADELIAYLDFLANFSSVASTFTVVFTNALTISN